MTDARMTDARMTDASGRPMKGITVPYRVRFDECGPDGLVRTSALLRYAQDIAGTHSEGLGFSRAWYAERNLAWVVRSAELVLLAPLPLGATISLSTAPTGFRRVWGRRRTEGRLEDGTLAFWGHTDWVMTDVARGLPSRIPEEFPAAFSVPPGTFEPIRVSLPPTPPDATLLPIPVRPQDIDPMGHVNNAVYLDYMEEALLATGGDAARAVSTLPRRVLLDYVVAASPGSVVAGATWRLEGMDDEGGWAWRLADDTDRELARGRVLAGEGATTGEGATR